MPGWQEPPSWPNEAVFEHGETVSCDLTPLGSNYTFHVTLQDAEGEQVKAIYKPRKGEVPLWDFPSGTLHLREYAAYLLAEALGWHFIPKTILRDGPHGEGSMQRYVEHNPRDTTSRSARVTRSSSPASVSSTCWPTTPIARLATRCSASTSAYGASITA